MPEHSPLHAEHLQAAAHLSEVDGWLVPLDFGDVEAEYAALREGAGLIDLSLRGKVRITGPDRATFLHNMVTQDIRALQPGRGCHALQLTGQGRMLGTMHVLALPDSLLCDLDPGATPQVVAVLRRHLVMEDAEILDVTSECALLALQGPHAMPLLAALDVNPEALREELQHAPAHLGGAEVRVVRSDHCGEGGFDLWVPVAAVSAVWRELRERGAASGVRPVGLRGLDLRRIEAGIPWYGSEITPEHFPQEAGLEAGWISYTKGCYLGQETISRLHHLGHTNRTLRGLLVEGHTLPAPGSALATGDRKVGAVTSAAHSPRLRRAVGLAYVHHDFAASGTFLDVEHEGGNLHAEVTALPLA